MSLKKSIQINQIEAMKAGQKNRLSALRTLFSDIRNKEIDLKIEISDDEIIMLIKKNIKVLEESFELYKQADKEETAQEIKEQISVLREYLPPDLTDEEIIDSIKKIAQENKDAIQTNPKAIIKLAMNDLRSKTDSSRVMKALKELSFV